MKTYEAYVKQLNTNELIDELETNIKYLFSIGDNVDKRKLEIVKEEMRLRFSILSNYKYMYEQSKY